VPQAARECRAIGAVEMPLVLRCAVCPMPLDELAKHYTRAANCCPRVGVLRECLRALFSRSAPSVVSAIQ